MAGRLAVTIIEAKALDNEDSISLNDPYIEVYIDDDYKQRTATISNSRTPRWDETFEFYVQQNQNHLYIRVYDDDGALGRDAIGSAKIDLEDVKKTGHFDQWVKLPKLFGLGSNGQVHISIQFRP